MITYLAQHDWALLMAWVLVFAIPGGVLVAMLVWPSPIDHARTVEGIRARIDQERAAAVAAAAADTMRLRPVKGGRPGRAPGSRPPSHRHAAA